MKLDLEQRSKELQRKAALLLIELDKIERQLKQLREGGQHAETATA